MRIIELSNELLDESTRLRDNIFNEIQDNEKATLSASLNISGNKAYLELLGINKLKYWVAYLNNSVIGIVGLYEEMGDTTNVWLGWFGVDSSYRKKGTGKSLLDFAMNQAKELNYKELHLYTYNSTEFKNAINLYKKSGFVEYTPNFNKEDEKDLYFKLALDRLEN